MKDDEKLLDDLEEKLANENKVPKGYKLIILFLCILIILLVGGIIFIFFYFQHLIKKNENNKKEEDEKSKEDYLLEINGFKEKWYDIYGNRTINISYLENDVVPNTYKKNGLNYLEELGEVNEGKDYTKHDVNVYDLYIPYSSLKRKDKHNGIILFVHGGGFENNTKEETECFAVRFAKLGFITANIEYSNCLDIYKEKSVYRILEEITACIKSIKKELISQGFDGDKLEMALYGISAGGQLILTYAFSNKAETIPIKFIMNSVGIASINSTYWYKPAIPNITLNNIESIHDIEIAKQNKSIIPIDRSFVLGIINAMSGKKLTKEEVKNLLINGEINIEDKNYEKIYNFAKFASPIEIIGKKDLVPMLCLYGGNDDLIGVNHFSLLKQAYIDNGHEDKIELVYMKYGGHERFHHGTDHDIIAMKKMHAKMVEYSKKYFILD